MATTVFNKPLDNEIATYTDVTSEFIKSSVTQTINAKKFLRFVIVTATVNVPSTGATAFIYPAKYRAGSVTIERSAGVSCFYTELSVSNGIAINIYPTSNISNNISFTVHSILYEQ